jgi:hypothetical protein
MRARATKLLSAPPVAGFAALVRERNDPNFVGLELIDDGVRKAAERKSSCLTAPNRAKSRVVKEDAEGALELGNERKSELSVGFSRVEEGSVNQL